MLCTYLLAWSKFKFAFGTFQNFFLNIFNPQLIESLDVEYTDVESTDMEDWLYIYNFISSWLTDSFSII